MAVWIGWIAPALMLLGVCLGHGKGDSLSSLPAWAAALVCLIAVSAWPLNIALCGVIVGARGAVVVRVRS